MLIAEDLMLILLDDETGKAAKSQQLPVALGGALLVELAMDGAVTLEPGEGVLGSETVRVGPGEPDEPLLLAALEVVREKPRRPRALVERLGKHARDEVAASLVARGVLERQEDRVLGLFPRTTWPTRDATHERDLRARLTRALVEGQQPSERDGAVIALLSAIDHAHQAVSAQGPGASRREVRRRAKEVAEGEWAAKAVKDAVQAAQAATVAVIAATSAATTSGS